MIFERTHSISMKYQMYGVSIFKISPNRSTMSYGATVVAGQAHLLFVRSVRSNPRIVHLDLRFRINTIYLDFDK